jgi:hypothetical protein
MSTSSQSDEDSHDTPIAPQISPPFTSLSQSRVDQSTFDDIAPSKISITESNDFRSFAGTTLDQFSDFVNRNIIAARYGTFAAITLLSVYGVAHSPLFFRIKNVSHIPSSYFRKRTKIQCRLVRIVENGSTYNTERQQSITCLVRHLSPAGSLLSRSAFDFFMNASPSTAVGKKLEEDSMNLMTIEIGMSGWGVHSPEISCTPRRHHPGPHMSSSFAAGIQSPHFYVSPNSSDVPVRWLHQLADERTLVTCQLLARRVNKSDLSLSSSSSTRTPSAYPNNQMALARLSLRPGRQWLPQDLAESLVKYGHASVSNAMLTTNDTYPIVETSSDLKHLEMDLKYMERLAKVEYQAVKESQGMWSDSRIRQERRDLVDEVEFQTKASMFQKLWRRFRGS